MIRPLLLASGKQWRFYACDPADDCRRLTATWKFPSLRNHLSVSHDTSGYRPRTTLNFPVNKLKDRPLINRLLTAPQRSCAEKHGMCLSVL